MSERPPLPGRGEWDGLAGEYALGSLSGNELAAAETLARREPAFALMVVDWHQRLAPLVATGNYAGRRAPHTPAPAAVGRRWTSPDAARPTIPAPCRRGADGLPGVSDDIVATQLALGDLAATHAHGFAEVFFIRELVKNHGGDVARHEEGIAARFQTKLNDSYLS